MSFVLTEIQEIDSILHAPINATQRIKYTCINASANYLALGSTSGSIYLFSREPCSFLQLIPLLEGAVTKIQISPDEKIIALATTRGTVCLVTVKPNIKLIGVSSEHIGKHVECLCWNDDSSEIYIGDGNGKVSVMIVSIFTVNGIFQSPSCTLMDLDSSIVQMTFESSLLLISSLTRCYLCNTSLEQYKQIGNQSRDGEFGACFFQLSTESSTSPLTKNNSDKAVVNHIKRTFDFISDNNNCNGTGKSTNEKLVKIFCARPGLRLWEVDALGIVIKTHQFKDALAVAPQSIYKLHCSKSLREKFDKRKEETWPVKSTHFSRLLVIQKKYLFSYFSNGLYIIDPINALAILWNDECTNISTANVVDDKIYLMSQFGTFCCLAFLPVDTFILKLYERKLLQECLRAVTLFKPQLLELVDEGKSSESTLSTLMNSLKRSKINTEKSKKTGIVLVNSYVPKIEEDLSSSSSSSSSSLSSFVNSVPMNRLEKSTLKGDCDEIRDALCEVQVILEETMCDLTNDLNKSVTEQQVEEAIWKVKKNIESTKKKYESKQEMRDSLFEVVRSKELHYGHVLLESLETLDILRKTKNNGIIIAETMRIFLDINSSKLNECCRFCAFSLPHIESLKQPKFLEIGRFLIEKFIGKDNDEICTNLCIKVPFLWREYMSLCDKQRLFASNDALLLKRCIQTRDKMVLLNLLSALDRRRWKIVTECLRNLKNGRCLSCGQFTDLGGQEKFIDWADIVMEIIKTEGSEAGLRFLNQLNDALPNVSFDKSVLRKIIFSKILNHHGISQVVEFDCTKNVEHHSVCSTKVCDDLINTLSKDIEATVEKTAFGSGVHHWGMRYTPKSSTCPCCTLSLQTPVLLGNNGIALFPCGHAYHVNCLIQKKVTRCNLHLK